MSSENAFDTGIGAMAKVEENVEVSFRHFATQGSRKEHSIVNSRSLRRRQIDEIELDLKAKKKGE